MASILNQSGYWVRWSSLVTIQRGDAKRPFFCVHALGGNVLSYKTLVNYLDPKQPVYALQAQGLDGKQVPYTTVEQMAAHYIKEIRAVQPKGPYLLGGHSSGGIVAYEMAQQLIAQGQKVALLALFDSYSPKLFISHPSRLRTILVYLRTLLRLPPKDKLSYFLEKSQWLQSNLQSQFNIRLRSSYNNSLLNKLQPHEIFLIETIKQATMVDYAPQLYQGRIALFRSKEELRWSRYQPQRGWEDLATGGLEIYDVRGTHLGMLENPAVKNLAEKLQVCIEQAQQV
jgi:thioesterase domain-containing protein